MSGYILALDQGTTSSRAIVFDAQGMIRGTGQREFPQHFPQPGWVEHDPEEIWQTQLMRRVTRSRRPVWLRARWRRWYHQPAGDGDGVGARHRPAIHNAIVWQCRRTADRRRAAASRRHEPLIREHTGLVPDAYFSGTKCVAAGQRPRRPRGGRARRSVPSAPWIRG